MTAHTLTLRYSGRRAGRGALLPSASKQVIAGAQMLLAAHGYYFTQGLVPDRLLDRSDYFEITDTGRQSETWSADFTIDVADDGAPHLLQTGFHLFFRAAYQAWLDRRLFEDPPWRDRQPYFNDAPQPSAALALAISPVFCSDAAARATHLRQLSIKTGNAMALITAPLVASASTLHVIWDATLIDTRTARLYSDADIEQALIAIKARDPSWSAIGVS